MNMETYSFSLNIPILSLIFSFFFPSHLILKQGHMIFLNNSVSAICNKLGGYWLYKIEYSMFPFLFHIANSEKQNRNHIIILTLWYIVVSPSSSKYDPNRKYLYCLFALYFLCSKQVLDICWLKTSFCFYVTPNNLWITHF